MSSSLHSGINVLSSKNITHTKGHQSQPATSLAGNPGLTCRRAGRAAEGGRRAGWRGSAELQVVPLVRLLVREGLSPAGWSEPVSGQVGCALDPSEWLLGQVGCPLVRAELQGWPGSGGCVSVSWGSASLSWGQTGNLWLGGKQY